MFVDADVSIQDHQFESVKCILRAGFSFQEKTSVGFYLEAFQCSGPVCLSLQTHYALLDIQYSDNL